MRQENGAELFGSNDPRGASVGIIHVAPSDDRQSILTAILTQDKLGRRHTVLLMSDDNAAFRRTTDFAYLKNLLRGLSTKLVIVASPSTSIAKFAQRQQFLVFRSLENYANYAQTFISEDQQAVSAEPEAQDTPPPPTLESDPQPLDQSSIQSRQTRPEAPTLVPQVRLPMEEDVPVPLQPMQIRPIILDEPIERHKPMMTPTVLQELPDSPQPDRKRTGRILVAAVLVTLLLLIGSTVLSVFAGIGPVARLFPGSSANVTITAEQKTFKMSYPISAVTWVPDPALHQVAAHFISSTTPSHSKTVQTSGQGITQATTALGLLTFYNALPYSQSIPAGTIFADEKGIQVATDGAVTIPAASPPTEGSMSAGAHALVPGAQGNIPISDFKEATCCHAGITLTNRDAFSGGHDARPYAYVQQSDIDMATSNLNEQLTNDGKKTIQGKIQSSEQQAGETKCTANSGTNHNAGERANNVTVSAVVTCVAEVFNHDDAYTMAANLLKSEATQTFRSSYAQASQVKTRLISATVQNLQGTTSLIIEAQGLWVAQFDATRQQKLAHLIAGSNAATAQDLLVHQPGIVQARITVADSPGNVLPDASKITLRVI